MAPPSADEKPNVELEELLRFKRAERPDAAFWEQFDARFEQRRLQALCAPEGPSLRHRLGVWFLRLGVAGMTAAAVALFALTGLTPEASLKTPSQGAERALATLPAPAPEPVVATARASAPVRLDAPATFVRDRVSNARPTAPHFTDRAATPTFTFDEAREPARFVTDDYRIEAAALRLTTPAAHQF